MAMDLLQKFFGTNPQRQQEYGEFLDRYQRDPGSISDEEAARRYREMMRNAPPDLAAQANEHAFGQLPQQDRRALADQPPAMKCAQPAGTAASAARTVVLVPYAQLMPHARAAWRSPMAGKKISDRSLASCASPAHRERSSRKNSPCPKTCGAPRRT